MIFIQYLLKFSISLAIVWLFYQLVLRKLTFYNSNRWYLLGYTLLSFFIPLIDISTVLEKNEWSDNTVVQWVPVIGEYNANVGKAATEPGSFFLSSNIITILFSIGVLVMLLRLMFQLLSFARMRKRARAIPADRVRLFQVDEDIIPFSFGNSIFINQQLHSTEELQEIIRHEFVHVRQRHSIDIIWSELLCMLNWYNPFAWLLKRSIRQNLEFIADNKVLENGIDKKQYQYLLLKVIGNNQFSIAPKFNFSSLKKRIAMMNKLRSARMHLVRFLFILPLLAVILLSFRKQISNSINLAEKPEATLYDTIPGSEWNPVPTESEKDFLRRHPLVKNITWGYMISVSRNDVGLPGKKGDAIMTINFKNGKWDMYNLGQSSDVQKFKKNYGEAPPTPPPYNVSHDVNDKGYQLEIADDKGNCTVVVKQGDKVVDRVLLNTWEQNPEKYEGKYGELELTMDLKEEMTGELFEQELVTDVKEIHVNDLRAEVILKNGKKLHYDLRNSVDNKAFQEKVGRLESEAPTTFEVRLDQNELNAVKEVNGPVIAKDFEITDNHAVMRLKDGTVDEFDLRNKEQRKAFEKKYGKIIEVNPTKHLKGPVTVLDGLDGHTLTSPTTETIPDGVLIFDHEGQVIGGEEEVLLTITSKTTQAQLDDMVRQMKEKGIQLKFTNSNHNDGILNHVEGTVKYKGSNSHFSATDFHKLIISTVKDGERVYMKVDVVEKKQQS